MTRDEAIFALHYGRRYGTRSSRFWGKISTSLLVVELLAGGTAFAGFVAEHQGMAAGSGLAIAIAAAINIALAPKEKQIGSETLRQQYAKAIEAEPDLDDAALVARARDLQAEPAAEIESLRMPVWRDVCNEMGLPVPAPDRSPRIVERITAAIA